MVGNNPALTAQLAQIRDEVANSVNGQFAAAGRDFSGANQMAYGRGVAAGQAPVIAAQYNQDVANQIAAANAVYNAGNTTAGALSGLQQNYLANQGQGVSAAQSALDAQNYGANARNLAELIRAGHLLRLGARAAGLASKSRDRNVPMPDPQEEKDREAIGSESASMREPATQRAEAHARQMMWTRRNANSEREHRCGELSDS